MGQQQQLSRSGAVVVGLAFVACGAYPILIGLGLLIPTGPDAAPPWVVLSAGLLFVFAGLAIVIDYAIAGGVGPDGDLPAGTSLAVRGANLLLGLLIVGLMTAVFGWVAFGSGERHFSSTIALHFYASRSNPGEASGRVAFGAATLLLALMFVACGTVGVRRFVRELRARRPTASYRDAGRAETSQ